MFFQVDVNATTSCNFRCRYCYEHDHMKNAKYFSEDMADLFYRRIDEIIVDPNFQNDYKDGVRISFWGGEPTLHPDFIKDTIERYIDNPAVRLFIFTNGSQLEPLEDYLQKCKNIYVKNSDGRSEHKLITQVSYDGKIIHDKNRKDVKGQPTSDYILSVLLHLIDEKIPHTIKSTVPHDCFADMYYSYHELRELWEIGKSSNAGTFNSAYFPTIDYNSSIEYNNEELYTQQLIETVLKIAADDVPFHYKNKIFFFHWFNRNRALCSSGADMMAVDLNGDILKCHGCIYSDAGDHKVTNLKDADFILKLKESLKWHKTFMYSEPEACKHCTAQFCVRCNAACYQKSKEAGYIKRWTDYTGDQNKSCLYYQIASETFKQYLNSF